MVALNEIIEKIKSIQFKNTDRSQQINELYEILDNAQKKKLSNSNQFHTFLQKLSKFDRYRNDIGINMNEETSLMLTKFVIENCLSDELRYNENITNSVINNRFLTCELKYTYYHDNMRKALKEIYSYRTMNPIKLARILADQFSVCTVEEFSGLYQNLVPEELQDDKTFIEVFCGQRPSNIYKLLRCRNIDKDFALEIVKQNCDNRINFALLPDYVKEYIEENNLLPNRSLEDAIDKVGCLSEVLKNDLYKKLYFKFGKSYHEKYKGHKKENDKVFFMYNMLLSNVLEKIYSDPSYTVKDIDFVSAFLNMLEMFPEFRDIYPTEQIRNNMEYYRKKHYIVSTEIYNAFVVNKTNDDAIQKLTQKLGITRENAFKYVTSQKYWSKDQKEFVLTVLSSYFKLGNVITIYDIIDLLEEMSERGLTKEEILAEKNIDVKYFNKICENVKESNPSLYELMRSKFHANSLRGFKKFLLLYYSVMNSKIEDKYTFTNFFKRTPEEMIKLFKNSEFYDDVYNKISSWYTFDKEEENKPSEVAM